MPIVIKRLRKYFAGREGYFVPGLLEGAEVQDPARTMNDSDLLRTIKLSNNIFKLSLPEPTYGG